MDFGWEIEGAEGGKEGRENEKQFYIDKDPSKEMVLLANALARVVYLVWIARIGPGGLEMFFHPRRVCYNSCISLCILHSSR